MKAFAKRSGVAVGEVVAIVGQSCARELARKVQPWGLSQAVGLEFMESIEIQIRKAAKYAMQRGIEGDLKTVHQRLRNRRGAVTVQPSAEFEPKRKPFAKWEVPKLIDNKLPKAGRAKAGWIAAGESITSPLLKTARGISRKIKGVPDWVRRHVKSSVGTSIFRNNGKLSSTVYLTNNINYAYSKNNTNRGDVSTALSDGYKRSITMIGDRLKKLK